MIEIKNKRMILYPEDRIIGAQGDIESAERVFILDKIQGGYDLSDMICWIKLEPKGKTAFDQLVKRQIKGDKIILTWILSASCLANAGELSAQLIFADRGYFKESDLNSLDDGDFVVPQKISGVSAPVWQSHKEIFIVSESIDSTASYTEVSKNVLITALADAEGYSQDARQSAQNAKASELAAQGYSAEAKDYKNISITYSEIAQEQASLAESHKEAAAGYANAAADKVQECQNVLVDAQEISEICEGYWSESYICAVIANDSETRCAEYERKAKESADEAISQALMADGSAITVMEIQADVQGMKEETEEIYENTVSCSQQAQNALTKLQKARNYRLIYSKTLTDEDEGCISFEINQDAEGNALSLSECVFYIYCPKTEGAQSSYIKLEGTSEGNSVFARLAQLSLISTNNDVYCRAECLNRGRWIVKTAKGSSWDQNAESVTAQGAVCAQSRANDGSPLTALRLVQHSSVGVPFASGMSVEVWGVDSIKEEA